MSERDAPIATPEVIELHERWEELTPTRQWQRYVQLREKCAAQDAEIATLTKERDLWRREAKVQAGDRREP